VKGKSFTDLIGLHPSGLATPQIRASTPETHPVFHQPEATQTSAVERSDALTTAE